MNTQFIHSGIPVGIPISSDTQNQPYGYQQIYPVENQLDIVQPQNAMIQPQIPTNDMQAIIELQAVIEASYEQFGQEEESKTMPQRPHDRQDIRNARTNFGNLSHMNTQFTGPGIPVSSNTQSQAYGYQQVQSDSQRPAYRQFIDLEEPQDAMIQPRLPTNDMPAIIEASYEQFGLEEPPNAINRPQRRPNARQERRTNFGTLSSLRSVPQDEQYIMYPKPVDPTLSQMIVHYFQSMYEASLNRKRCGTNNRGIPKGIRTLARSTAPQTIKCLNCGKTQLTRTEHEVGPGSWTLAACFCIFGCIPCAFLPFSKPECQDTQHYCIHCGQKAGRLNFIFDNAL